ncbi:MAG: CPBP family intramembrane metalloprotease [Actinomycetota bacterium]|nr:CPBP family intramembrane metalloprotease [Actinomycetota bacterium]
MTAPSHPANGMPLDTTAIPLVAYAVGFQTLVYVLLPGRFRARWAPLVTGLVGAALVILAGAWFDFDTIGLGVPDGGMVAAWGLGTIAVMSMVAMVMLSHPQLRGQLADPRMAAMSRRQAASQILIRIPITTALIEEAVFRGVLHAALFAIYPAPIALWAGAALFGIWHVGPGLDQAKATNRRTIATLGHVTLTVVVTTLVGAGLVWLRMETGSIWAPLAVHAGLNMTMAVFARTAASKSLPVWARYLVPAAVAD